MATQPQLGGALTLMVGRVVKERSQTVHLSAVETSVVPERGKERIQTNNDSSWEHSLQAARRWKKDTRITKRTQYKSPSTRILLGTTLDHVLKTVSAKLSRRRCNATTMPTRPEVAMECQMMMMTIVWIIAST